MKTIIYYFIGTGNSLAARGKCPRRLLLQSSHNLPLACGAGEDYRKNPPVKPDFPTKMQRPGLPTITATNPNQFHGRISMQNSSFSRQQRHRRSGVPG